MKRFFFSSLRARLIILVLVAIIPSLIIILHAGWEARKVSALNAEQGALQLAVVASGNQDLLIESTRQLLAGLAHLPELHRADARACSILFADLLKQYQQYNNIIAVKPNGDLWCSGVPAGGPTNYADRGWFPTVLRTRDFVVGEYVIGRITKKPQSSLAYPLLAADGKVQKIIVTGFGLDWLNQFIAQTKLPPGSVLTVIDRNGTVLARSLEPDKWVGQTVKQAPIVNAIRSQQKQGTLETIGIDGIKRLYAFAPLGTQARGSVYVFVGIPTSVAYAPAHRLLARNLTALALAALLAFVISWVGGDLFLLRRINALLHTVKRLEDGDLSARTDITYGPGELSQLARAFDQMAAALEQRVTEIQRTEKELRASNELFSLFMRHSPIYTFIKEVTPGRSLVLRASDNYRQMIGIPGSAMVGKTMTELFPPEFAAQITTDDWTVVAHGVVLKLDEELNGRSYTTIKFPIVSGDKTLLAGYTIDITERKQAEEEKMKLQSQLLHAQKMESIGRLAGGVAHDFNNMLGVILGHVELAIEKADTGQPLLADLREIRNAAERSAALTRQMLAFARKQTISPRVLDMNETVAGMLKMLMRLIGEEIDLVWLPGVDLWRVKIDPSQIDQILANLCVNARDAIAEVGKVTIETQNVHFDDDYCAAHAGFVPGDYVLLAVSDDGCGMDKATLDNLFEPFFTTKGVGNGTGLGLATCYGIIKQNNGFINVYSEPDQGTTLKIYLPRHQGRAEPALREAMPEPVTRGRETILLVEDEPALLDLSKLLLETQGYRVLAAGTPGEALRLAEEHAGGIQLLMTDVVMPEMNGRDLAKKLLSLSPHLKCLFTSGYTANVIAHHGVLTEGVHFIQKPFSRKDLAAKVREALDESGLNN